MKLSKNRTLLVDGPASITLIEGTANILAAQIREGEPLTVPKHRRLPVETNTNAELQVRIGPDATYKQVEGSTIPSSWRRAYEAVRESLGLVVVLGDVDAGKSTLTAFIANSCFKHHVRTSIVDGDVGQADIGPPTTTSSAAVTKQVFSLSELVPERSYFVGDTSPSLVPEKLERSLARLREKLHAKSDLVILNTDGWLREDNAIQHKIHLLENLQPDLVLALSSGSELDPILDSQKCPFLQLKPSEFARTRTREQRKKTREEGYRRFLQNSTKIELRPNAIQLRMFNKPKQLRIDYSSIHRGTLAGLLDEEDQLIAIGRILGIENGRIRITTEARKPPKTVELGSIILSSRYEEIGFEN